MAMKISGQYRLPSGNMLQWVSKSLGECDDNDCERVLDEMYPEPEFAVVNEENWTDLGSIEDVETLIRILTFAVQEAKRKTQGKIHVHYIEGR